jgi:hypothetical protein
MKVDLREYLLFIAERIEAAGKVGNRIEVLRLFRLLAAEAHEQAMKLERELEDATLGLRP